MNGRSGVMLVAVLAVGVSVGAQSSGESQKPTDPASARGKATTIVGCLVQGFPKGDAAPPDADKYAQDFFIRTPTVRIPPGATVAVGTPGSGSTTPAFGTPVEDSFYRVTGLGAERLRPHLGHRIELQGELTDNTPGIETSRARTTQDKDGRATTTVETRIAIAGVMNASALQMVSTDCPK
jgi:hypothetical protein